MMLEGKLSGGPLGGRIYAIRPTDTKLAFDIIVDPKTGETRTGTYLRDEKPIRKGTFMLRWQGLDPK